MLSLLFEVSYAIMATFSSFCSFCGAFVEGVDNDRDVAVIGMSLLCLPFLKRVYVFAAVS